MKNIDFNQNDLDEIDLDAAEFVNKVGKMGQRASSSVSIMVGTIFLLIGGIISAVFLSLTDLNSIKFMDPLKVSSQSGQIISSVDASLEVNGVSYYKSSYSYQFDGQSYQGVSYGPKRFKAGDKVPLEVITKEPSISRIEGYQTSPFPIFVLFVLIFPLIGFGILVSGLIGRAKGYSLSISSSRGLRSPPAATSYTVSPQSPQSYEKGRIAAFVLAFLIFVAYLFWKAYL